MNAYDEEALQRWTEREVRAVIGLGADPSYTVAKVGQYKPTGQNAWFGYAIGEVLDLASQRRIAKSWEVAPPRHDWRRYAPAIRRHADELTTQARLPSDMALAEWYHRNESVLRRDPDNKKRSRTVAVALLPLFEAHAECWAAVFELDDDFSRGSFANLLADWHARAPEKCRGFIKRVAREFGLNIGV